MTAPVASGWSVTGWGSHPLESAALSRRTQIAVVPGSGSIHLAQRCLTYSAETEATVTDQYLALSPAILRVHAGRQRIATCTGVPIWQTDRRPEHAAGGRAPQKLGARSVIRPSATCTDVIRKCALNASPMRRRPRS